MGYNNKTIFVKMRKLFAIAVLAVTVSKVFAEKSKHQEDSYDIFGSIS